MTDEGATNTPLQIAIWRLLVIGSSPNLNDGERAMVIKWVNEIKSMTETDIARFNSNGAAATPADTITAINKALEGLIDQAEHVCLGAHTPSDIRQSAKNLADPIEKAHAALSTLESLQRENEALRAFASSFKLSHNEMAFYGDCYIHIDNPDKVSFRLGNGSQFSHFIGNLEKRRVAALSSTGDTHGN